jgi:hypothetical protein
MYSNPCYFHWHKWKVFDLFNCSLQNDILTSKQCDKPWKVFAQIWKHVCKRFIDFILFILSTIFQQLLFSIHFFNNLWTDFKQLVQILLEIRPLPASQRLLWGLFETWIDSIHYHQQCCLLEKYPVHFALFWKH